MIKLNLFLMLTGSDPLWLPGKKRHRGELQMLMVGDAATAKTSHAELIIQCFNRGVWASGVKGASSAVGLRASVVYDSQTNASRVSAGAHLMASTKYGGLVVIDEVADMNQDDYRSILEATDDRQTITIRKHQMAKEIQVNCASLHLANPKTPGLRWDSNKNIHENTGLDTPMLTRYDTIWILRDVMDKQEDIEIAQHSLNMNSLGLQTTIIRRENDDDGGYLCIVRDA
jgi:DNA replicative helicase MCM subunit Mcm2 (Cdc46/Mcm family)